MSLVFISTAMIHGFEPGFTAKWHHLYFGGRGIFWQVFKPRPLKFNLEGKAHQVIGNNIINMTKNWNSGGVHNGRNQQFLSKNYNASGFLYGAIKCKKTDFMVENDKNCHKKQILCWKNLMRSSKFLDKIR